MVKPEHGGDRETYKMFGNYFQGHIEDLIREIVSSERYGQLDPQKISEIAVQVTLFFTNILFSITGALLVGAVAYLLVNRHQTRSAQITKEIERQRLLHELEKGYQELASARCVWLPSRKGFKPDVTYSFVVALTGQVPWNPPKNIEYQWDTGDRLVVFTSDRGLISSSAIHEALFWFRRVNRAYSARLLHADDLYEMWRQLLPFVTDFRYSFMAEYFGGKQRRGIEDIEAVKNVIEVVLQYCQRMNKQVPLDYLDGRLDPLFYQSLPQELSSGINPAGATNGPTS